MKNTHTDQATRAVLLAAALALGFSGCGSGLSSTVDSSKLREMSRRGQLWIYDAENEIVVALDRLDEAKDELEHTRERIKQAQHTIERAEKKNRGVQVAEAWLVYLERLEKWAKASIRLHTLGVIVARAGVELAKAQVIQREDLVGSFNVRTFQDQYNELKKRFDKRRDRVDKMRRDARKLEERWWKRRRAFVARTNDYDSGLWTD